MARQAVRKSLTLQSLLNHIQLLTGQQIISIPILSLEYRILFVHDMSPAASEVVKVGLSPAVHLEKATASEPARASDTDVAYVNPAPFRELPTRLAMMVDPKSLEELEQIGGAAGLLEGLGVDRKTGLIEAGGGADRAGDAMRPVGAQWQASIEMRQQVYGVNELPRQPVKSLLQLMLLAFKDKILVGQSPYQANLRSSLQLRRSYP